MQDATPLPKLSTDEINELITACNREWGNVDRTKVETILQHHKEVLPVLAHQLVQLPGTAAPANVMLVNLIVLAALHCDWRLPPPFLQWLRSLTSDELYDTLMDFEFSHYPVLLACEIPDVQTRLEYALHADTSPELRSAYFNSTLSSWKWGQISRQELFQKLREAFDRLQADADLDSEWESRNLQLLAYWVMLLGTEEQRKEFAPAEARMLKQLDQHELICGPMVNRNAAELEKMLEEESGFDLPIDAVVTLDDYGAFLTSPNRWQPNIDDRSQVKERQSTRELILDDPPALPVKTEQIHRPTVKVGRNEPCPCGSGKKYKKCCGGQT